MKNKNVGFQPNFEESKVQQTNYWNPSTSQVTPLKNFQRNVSLGSAGTSPCTPSTPSSYYSRSFRRYYLFNLLFT